MRDPKQYDSDFPVALPWTREEWQRVKASPDKEALREFALLWGLSIEDAFPSLISGALTVLRTGMVFGSIDEAIDLYNISPALGETCASDVLLSVEEVRDLVRLSRLDQRFFRGPIAQYEFVAAVVAHSFDRCMSFAENAPGVGNLREELAIANRLSLTLLEKAIDGYFARAVPEIKFQIRGILNEFGFVGYN